MSSKQKPRKCSVPTSLEIVNQIADKDDDDDDKKLYQDNHWIMMMMIPKEKVEEKEDAKGKVDDESLFLLPCGAFLNIPGNYSLRKYSSTYLVKYSHKKILLNKQDGLRTVLL